MQARERNATARRVTSALGTVAGLVIAWRIVAGDPVCVYFWFGGPLFVVCTFVFAAVFGTRAATWAGLLASLVVAVSASIVMRLGTPKSGLTTEGDRIVAALDGYRREHGRYPEHLRDAGIQPEWNRYGGWEYESREDGTRWNLSVGGDISAVNGFVYYTSSERRQWGYDDG